MPTRFPGLCSLTALILALPACGGSAKVTFDPRSPNRYPAKEPGCAIEVFDSAPERSYVELGVIHYHHERHRASDDSLTLDVALPEIKNHACRAGADAVMDVHVTDRVNLEWRIFHVVARAIRFEP